MTDVSTGTDAYLGLKFVYHRLIVCPQKTLEQTTGEDLDCLVNRKSIVLTSYSLTELAIKKVPTVPVPTIRGLSVSWNMYVQYHFGMQKNNGLIGILIKHESLLTQEGSFYTQETIVKKDSLKRRQPGRRNQFRMSSVLLFVLHSNYRTGTWYGLLVWYVEEYL